ncbi:MAG: SRPBCC family protein, partial [Gammaproteobacteria bacterium]|nr:SRPBCC family protein [Gammaproteobacteria bacterium]
MAEFTMMVRIAAPADKVFDVFSDIDKFAGRVDGIMKVEKLTNGPVDKGTRWLETRIVMNKESTEELEIIEFEKGSGYTVACDSHGTRYRTVFTFLPQGDET